MPKNLGEALEFANSELRLRDHLKQFTDHSRSNIPVPEPMDCSALSAGKPLQDQLDKLEQATQALVGISQILATSQQPQQFHQQQGQSQQQHQVRGRNQFQQFQVQPQISQQYQQQPTGPTRPPGRPPPMFRQAQRNQPIGPSIGSDRDNPQGYRWTPDHKPICHYCGHIGHVQRACRKKAAAMNIPNRPPPVPRQGN